MVLLTMTPAVAEVVQLYLDHAPRGQPSAEGPPLDAPAEGKPISHRQLIDISRHLKSASSLKLRAMDGRVLSLRLSHLLRGCSVYVPPRQPKPQQTDEYKRLMARLRMEDEEQKYERMLNSAPVTDPFTLRTPAATHPQLFSDNAHTKKDIENEEMSYADVNRQMALILNVLISIIACSFAIWMAARHWSVPPRLALSMSGGILVGVAEVVIYSGYLRRLDEARKVERKVVEVKQIAETWVIEATKDSSKSEGLRMRSVKGSEAR